MSPNAELFSEFVSPCLIIYSQGLPIFLQISHFFFLNNGLFGVGSTFALANHLLMDIQAACISLLS